jgi:transposase-like protein
MKNRSGERISLTPAQRGRIVQRILVDGWTSAEAAASFDVPERLVDAWIADYRRCGMASLRHAPCKTVANEVVRIRFLRPLRTLIGGVVGRVRRFYAPARPASPARLRSNDDRRGGS